MESPFKQSVVVAGGQLAAGRAGVDDALGLEEHGAHLMLGARAMLDALRDDKQLTRAERDIAVAECDRELAGEHQEQLVGVVVGMPDEFALQPDDLDLVVVEPRDDLRRPLLVDAFEPFTEVDHLIAHPSHRRRSVDLKLASCCLLDGMPDLTRSEIAYLDDQRLARLATAGPDGRPHVVPVSLKYNAELGTIDTGGFHVDTTKKHRDLQANPWAAIVVDDLVTIDPWTPRMLEICGRAEALPTGGEALGAGFGDALTRIHPDRVNSFGLTDGGSSA